MAADGLAWRVPGSIGYGLAFVGAFGPWTTGRICLWGRGATGTFSPFLHPNGWYQPPVMWFLLAWLAAIVAAAILFWRPDDGKPGWRAAAASLSFVLSGFPVAVGDVSEVVTHHWGWYATRLGLGVGWTCSLVGFVVWLRLRRQVRRIIRNGPGNAVARPPQP